MNSEISFEFDPYSLLNDFPPPSEDDHQDTHQPDCAEPTFSDELEGIREVAQERVERLTKERVVIQHRQWGGPPLFRSSSLPPDSPTPVARRGPIFQSVHPDQEPTRNYQSPFPSSPPPIQSNEASMNVDDPPIEDSTMETSPDHSKAPSIPKPFKPDFSKPLTGGLFGKLKRASKPNGDGEPQSARTQDITTTGAKSQPQKGATETLGRPATGFYRPLAPRKQQETTTIVTNSGTRISVRRKQNAIPEVDILDEPSTSAPNFFGVDIYNIMESNTSFQKPLGELPAELEEPVQNGSTATVKKRLLWTEKYRAKRFKDLVGDERTHRQVMHWLKSWDPIVFSTQNKPLKKKPVFGEEEPERTKILLIHGPPGLGKTTLAHVAARQAGYEPVEINASDDRSRHVVEGKIKTILSNEGVKRGLKSGKSQTVSSRPICLIIDEIDGVTGGAGGGGGGGGGETGFIKSLIDLIKADETSDDQKTTKKRRGKSGDAFKINRPIIALCNDLYAPALKPLRAFAETVQIRAPPKGLLVDRLESIFSKEGYATEDGAVRKVVELSSRASTAGNSGDMRSALVNAEWISARLKQHDSAAKVRGTRRLLTKKMVEEELGGDSVGINDGKTSSGARTSIRDTVESVFCVEQSSSKSKNRNPKSSCSKVAELVDALGEFDKITLDCFATYPKRQFHDDFVLTKPNIAYEWLWFHDLISSRAFGEQHHGLSVYLSQPVVAFHQLFATANSNQNTLEDEDQDLPFNGPAADWEARESGKEHKAMAQSIHTSLGSIRLGQTFKSQSLIITELAPYINLMLSPRVNPVVVGGSSGYGVASVRRESERKLINHAVVAMEATGVRFEKMRVETVPGEIVGSGWAYRMDPPLDQLDVYPTLANKDTVPVRYAIRQVMDQEWRKSLLLRQKASREARMGAPTGHAPPSNAMPAATVASENLKRPRGGVKVKKDFFGRIISQEPESGESGPSKKRKVATSKLPEVWVSFNEGFSNAVRKGVRLSELMDGL